MSKREDFSNEIWYQENDIFFYCGFERQKVNALISYIEEHKNNEKLRIRLKTNGGNTDELMPVIDLVIEYQIPIHVDGYAYSAGFDLFCASPKRTMGKNAFLLYHQTSYSVDSQFRIHEDNYLFNKEQMEKFRQRIASTGAFEIEELEEYDKQVKDLIIDYDEALSRGLIKG
jgi:ATP-dependent protease ClpP protease subunit